MNTRGLVGTTVLVTIGLAACVPTAPAHYSADAEPTTHGPSGEAIAPAGDFTTDSVERALASLPVEDELTWQGGGAFSQANDPGDVYSLYIAEPEECLVFYAAEKLTFSDDAETVREDVTMTTTLINPHGPGYDDNDWYAKVTVRLMGDPTLAASELLDPMVAAAPQCSSYYIHYTLADWRTTDVHSLVLDDNADVHASASRALAALVDEDALEYGNTSWAIALVDNALVFVAYYGGEGAPFPDDSGAVTLMDQVLTSLDAARAG
jgi:hypothetical protein